MTDLRVQLDNLQLLLESVEDELEAKREYIQVAETTQAWLVRLRARIEEVEEDTPEAFEKRRELVQLLVERILVDRAPEKGSPRVRITYRFGPPPEPVDEADVSVYGDNYSSAFFTTSAFCSAAKRASGSSS